MTLRIPVKPRIMYSNSQFSYCRNKKEFEQKIVDNFGLRKNFDGTYSNDSILNRNRDKPVQKVGINFEKRNPVYKQIKFKNGKTKKTELVSKGFWIAWVYHFPAGLDIKIKQGQRNFTIINK